MSNALIILLAYGLYLAMVVVIALASWHSEKLDPDNDLTDSIWDEIFPQQTRGRPHKFNELNWLSILTGKHFHS